MGSAFPLIEQAVCAQLHLLYALAVVACFRMDVLREDKGGVQFRVPSLPLASAYYQQLSPYSKLVHYVIVMRASAACSEGSEAPSSGGCMIPPPTSDPSQFASSGVDCSTLEGVLDVSCNAGKCAVTRCQHGFDISPNGTDCLPQKHISAEPTRTMALPFGKADLSMSISIAAALYASQTMAADQDQDQAFSVNKDDGTKAQPDVFYVPGHKLPTVPESPSQISEDQSESEANALSSAPSTGSTLNAIMQTGGQTEALKMDSDLAMSMEGF